jgi:MarR family 2-MHQ and catechol resistance regulon transcriptional repressor
MKSTAHTLSGTHLWLVLMKAHRSLMRHAGRSHKAHDLGLSEFVVLEMLLHKGPQKVNDIGRRVALTSGAITTAVDRVEKRGLVVRTFDRSDRRARIVKLTPKGEALIERVFEDHAEALDRAAGGLNAKERASLVTLLKKLGMFAERLADDEPAG